MSPRLVAFTIVILIGSLLSGGVIQATISSSSYQIQWDTVSDGGGDDATSTTYELRDTLGNAAIGESTSASYTLRAGYRQAGLDTPTLSFTISATACALGQLETTEVDGCVLTLTTTTNATNGYVTTVYNSATGLLGNGGPEDIDAVADGSITAGSEEYGISTEDDDADVSQFAGGAISTLNCNLNLSGPLTTFDAMTTAAQSVVETGSPASGEATNVCIAASISTLTAAGDYQDTVTFVSTGYY